MKNALVDFLVQRALPLIVPVIVYPLMQILKKLWSWLDEQSELVKNTIVIALGVVVSALFTYVGVALPAECGVNLAAGITESCWSAIATNQTVIAGVVGSLLAILWKKARQAQH